MASATITTSNWSHYFTINSDNTKVLNSNDNLVYDFKDAPGSVNAVSGVDTANNEFTVNADITNEIEVGDTIRIEGSTGNDGQYTVASISGTTTVGVEEDVTDSTADGVLQTQFWAIVATDGGDIRICDNGTSTAYSYELENFDTQNATGVMFFDSSSLQTGSDTYWDIYAGNGSASLPAPSDTLGAQNVWNSNYEAVWHLDGSYDGTTGEVKDSTANNNDGTAGNAPSQVDGKIGKAQSFDGTDDNLQVPDDASLRGYSQFSVSAWFRHETVQDCRFIASNDTGKNYLFGSTGTEIASLWVGIGDGTWASVTTNSSTSTGVWYHVIATYDSSTEDAFIYVNGSQDGSNTSMGAGGAGDNSQYISIGGDVSNNNRYLDGVLAEQRITNAVLSSSYASTEYNNQSSPSTFWTTGSWQSLNTAPDAPTNPSPSDGASGVATDTSLSVDVSDPDGDSMDVSFYWDDGTLIEEVTGVADGGTATTSSLSLNNDQTYNWYAVADDGTDTTQSSTWSFTTEVGVGSVRATTSAVNDTSSGVIQTQ